MYMSRASSLIFLFRDLSREDNIRMDLKEIGINARNWVDFAQDRNYSRALVNAAFNPGFHRPWS